MICVNVACFEDFRCIAGACPDTCCAGWEVDLDDAILAKYETLPGPVGQEIRSRIRQEDGYTFFEMESGRCPFLNKENLCRLILSHGDGCLSVTCREHPRFWEEYGHIRETCLAISCPEAARLLLSQPFRLVVTETEEPDVPEEALDEELLEQLLAIREALFTEATASRPMAQRLLELEKLGCQVQGITTAPRRDVRGLMEHMLTLEFTDNRLPALLKAALDCAPAQERIYTLYNEYGMEAENLLLYFLYRYILRAVWDGCVTEKVLLCTNGLEAIFTLAAAQPGAFEESLLRSAILFSREVEHSPENLEKLYEFLF